MKAGDLRHRVTIQQNTPTANAFGERVDSWVSFATVWAAVEPISSDSGGGGNERWLQQVAAEVAEATTRIRLRYQPGITTAMRATHRGNIYDFEAVINRETRDREIWLLCKTVDGALGPDGATDGC